MVTAAFPSWAHCGQGAGPGDLVGCRGVAIPGSARCLAHATPAEQTAYLASLSPGADLDLRGTAVDAAHIQQIHVRTNDPATGRARLGNVLLDQATFAEEAEFSSTDFTGSVSCTQCTFEGNAWFDGAVFAKGASFKAAHFVGDARFDRTAFPTDVWFVETTFSGDAHFTESEFGSGWFHRASFAQNVLLTGAVFARHAGFNATFARASWLGPLSCGTTLDLGGAVFAARVTVQAAARKVACRRTQWAQPATLTLRYAEVDLTDAVCEYPLAVAGHLRPFLTPTGPLDESALASAPEQPRVASLQGVDAAQLLLTDLDLTECLFAGTIHLDQVRLEGDCSFAKAPAGFHWRRWRVVRHTRRSTLAEEQHWRSTRPASVPGWQLPLPGADIVQPSALAALYRALRKSYEDSSNAPGAADFYYGEMEMRRVDRRTAPAERGLITAYWALSGYGLRATRALGWLLLAVILTMLVMMLWGLPERDAPLLSTGTLTGHRITMTTDDSDPENPTGPVTDRLTSARFEKSLRVVVNSVIFRTSGQNLTTTGTYTEMASRLTEPVLLGLAALAVRGRIKR
ncbi:pentapeptide repeat-containing protein [Streptomyces sp. GMY02]|uniref:pentapeptide repeat-containing protein n=1 Tax=Streptomyces sp. GMY02 TaxID=1333528 RepID=UPI001C2CAFC3|nr:pentapeptide repeat-containing protein [Streptomyces sp. GMY02]QXE39535.1 pentapeptide repeat-containing protein [Streptomyces sp. GMY02]